MSHARTVWQTDIESQLSNGRMTDREHTKAGKAAVAKAATVREHEVFTNLSAWLKVKQIGWAAKACPSDPETESENENS